MRDMKNVDAQGIGKSKEYGFVSFTTHDHALQALRSINNNPNIFTSAKVRVRLGGDFYMSPFLLFLFQNCSKKSCFSYNAGEVSRQI
jgi:RNA recognition motif-containing protein